MTEFTFLLSVLQCYVFICTAGPPAAEFYVVSRGDPLHYEKVKESLSSTLGFNRVRSSALRPAVFLLHGLGGSHQSDCNEKISDGLLDRGGVNIVVADYHFAVQGPSYDDAVRNVEDIGKAVGDFLLMSQNDGSIDLSSTTLIGFSLGAHVAGIAGFLIKENNSAFLRRIIALDPAKPVFASLPTEKRLDRSDADYVMAIHTAGGLLGIDEPIGHADFFPNGGKEIQPLCRRTNQLSSLICSHGAACTYLAESIARPVFVAVKCSSWEEYLSGACRGNEQSLMGFDTDTMTQGTFFLNTSPIEPYGFDEIEFDDDVEASSEYMRHHRPTEEVLSNYHWYPKRQNQASFASAATPLLFFGVSTFVFTYCLKL